MARRLRIRIRNETAARGFANIRYIDWADEEDEPIRPGRWDSTAGAYLLDGETQPTYLDTARPVPFEPERAIRFDSIDVQPAGPEYDTGSRRMDAAPASAGSPRGSAMGQVQIRFDGGLTLYADVDVANAIRAEREAHAQEVLALRGQLAAVRADDALRRHMPVQSASHIRSYEARMDAARARSHAWSQGRDPNATAK